MRKKISGKELYDSIEKDNLDNEDREILEDIKNTSKFNIGNYPTYSYLLYN